MEKILVDGVEYSTHSFEYGHEGKRWGLDIVARDAADAQARVRALAFAQYKGEVVFQQYIPLRPSWLSRLRKVTQSFLTRCKTLFTL